MQSAEIKGTSVTGHLLFLHKLSRCYSTKSHLMQLNYQLYTDDRGWSKLCWNTLSSYCFLSLFLPTAW